MDEILIEKLPQIKTPYYLLNEEKLNKNFFSLKKEFEKEWNNFIIGYSFKTNSLPWILDWMKNNGAFAEVVSEAEYKLALKVGYPPEKIILNGPYKGTEILRYALDNDSIVNLDSFHEIEWIKNNTPNNNKIWKVGLRINFDLEKYCLNETIMGEEGSRFGFSLENNSINEAINQIEQLDYVKIVGLHGHNSTKTKSLNIFKMICEKICETAEYINNELEYVDVGGCLFGDKPNTPSFSSYAKIIKKELLKKFDIEKTTLIVEPGAAIIASPIDFICSVIDIKDIRDKRIVTTDGSCLNIDPQMHGIKFSVEINSSGNKIIKRQIITGYTCIEKDRLAILENKKELKINDFLIFKNTGAYSMALSPLFIQYYPNVIIRKQDKFYYGRKAWDVNEYLIKSYFNYEKPIGR